MPVAEEDPCPWPSSFRCAWLPVVKSVTGGSMEEDPCPCPSSLRCAWSRPITVVHVKFEEDPAVSRSSGSGACARPLPIALQTCACSCEMLIVSVGGDMRMVFRRLIRTASAASFPGRTKAESAVGPAVGESCQPSVQHQAFIRTGTHALLNEGCWKWHLQFGQKTAR